MANYYTDKVNIHFQSILNIEEAVISCFRNFKIKDTRNNFELFEDELKKSKFHNIFHAFPVAQEIYRNSERSSKNTNLMIQLRFINDQDQLQSENIIKSPSTKIKKIDIGAGDLHKGISTSVVNLFNHQKIVFKPTQINISESFFCFLDWVNQYSSLGDYRYRIFGNINYHWLEFVNHVPCETKENVQLYYERAGFLLGILYLLNGVDFHFENIIAKGTTPVVIDHETIIQPKIHSEIQKYFRIFIEKEYEDSVISTMLLPNHGENATMPLGTCGFGYHKQRSMQTLKKEAVDRYTNNWRFVTKFAEEGFQKQNIPTLNGEAIYPVEYLGELLIGFNKCYELLLNHRKFLLEDEHSPLRAFSNNTVRYIWRATSTYGMILNHMKLPKNLVCFEHYEQKIHDYLAVAFKNVPKDSNLWLIHKHELAQILRGDIPFFEVNSSSRDLETEFGTIKDFFELSAVENIERKLKKLSLEDLGIQKNLIKESVLS